jgi:hypothetical protein
MNDKSKTKTQKAQRRDIEFETENRGSLTLSPKPELERQNKPENPDEKPIYAGYIFFGSVTCAAIAALMFWSNSRVFLDAHAGSISALATIAIMVLTFAYVIYAKSQWKVMDGQLKEMRDTGIQMGQQVEVMRGQLTATQDLVGAYRDGLTQNRQRDRARVVIVLDRINPQPDVNLGVTCRLENGGQGRAFILNSLGKFVYSNTTDINPGIPPNWSRFFWVFV